MLSNRAANFYKTISIGFGLIWGIIGLFGCLPSQSQQIGNYSVVLQALSIEQLPPLQSFVVGHHDGDYLFIGGRKDGLHRRQPWATFWESENNKTAYVLNISSGQLWSADLSTLPSSLYEQLQSTNMEFKQIGDYLYIVGGYGYSTTAGDHITYPYLTAVNVPLTIAAIKAGMPINNGFFRQIEHTAMQVTGGYLGYLDGIYYLVGGQKFMGRYNPMGPDHGPGFVQEYTNQIRKFEIIDDGTNLSVANFTAVTDTQQLHRRDYNLVPQIFPNGERGFTAFSGVFQYAQDIPWLNTVDITPNGYAPNNDFEQLLNQYHSAHLAIYDSAANQMHTLFFGGIGRYYFDENEQLVDDANVPFVKTISLVTRHADGTMEEFDIGKMPDFLGAGAEFIPISETTIGGEGEIVLLNQLSGDTIPIGYIYGGILSSAENIFFINEGNESTASNKLYRVSLVPNTPLSVPTVATQQQNNSLPLVIKTTPNPNHSNMLNIELQVLFPATLTLEWLDAKGQLLGTIVQQKHFEAGKHLLEWSIDSQSKGMYFLRAGDGKKSVSVKVIR